MQTLFSTAGLHPRNAFKNWRETLSDRGLPLEQRRLDDTPFNGSLEIASVGSLWLTRITQGAMRSEATSASIRGFGKEENVSVIFRLAGTSTAHQRDRSSVQRKGDLFVTEHCPNLLTSSADSQALQVELPREQLERVFGPIRLYAALTVGAELASTSLALGFFQQLTQVRNQLTPATAERMASIGVDLIVASLAERMAQEVPHSIHGNATVQRAKAYVEVHLSDTTLDPPHLAAAVGVSLRRLQELFHERGRHISDYIWGRRLEAAAKRLNDPACAHLSIGMLAYGYGFSSQAHFARRFKDRYGMSPREYRQAHRLGVQPVASASGLSSKLAG